VESDPVWGEVTTPPAPPVKAKRVRKKKLDWPETRYDLILVLWDDAAGFEHGWTAKHEKLEPQLCVSSGFLIRENADHIMIASDTDGEGSHNGRTQIPRGMVKEIVLLKKADNKYDFLGS